MSFEVTPGVIEAATAAGLAIGAIATWGALRNESKKYESVVENYGPVAGLAQGTDTAASADAFEVETAKTPYMIRAKRIGRGALKYLSLPVAAATAAGVFPIAFGELPSPTITARPYVEEAVVLSGQVSASTANAMAGLNSDLARNSALNIDVILSRGGSFEQGNIKPSQVASFEPTGSSDSFLPTVEMAIGEAYRSANPYRSANINPSNVLVVSAGNDLDPSQVINEAKTDGTNIYVVNVGSGPKDGSQTVSDLQQIAKDTDGGYYPLASNIKSESQTAAKLGRVIEDKAQHFRTKENDSWQDLLKALDIGALLGAGALAAKLAGLDFRRRKLSSKKLKLT